MTSSIWRYAHLILASISTTFLLILSITGVILAIDAAQESSQPYKANNIDELSLAETLVTIQNIFFEVIEIQVDYNDFVSIQAIQEDGSSIHSYIDPNTGKVLAEVKPKSSFIQWITALHRSLFLKEAGRAIVAIVSFLLFLITISGFILILKRQKGIQNFFNKVNKDSKASYVHVVLGRLLLIPILIIALTGTFIFMLQLDLFQSEGTESYINKNHKEISSKNLDEFSFFKNTRLGSVKRIEFPFIPDDEDEPFIVHLKKSTISINQINGSIISESIHPYSAILEEINLDLHTGRTSIVWAIILGVASLNILIFIYTGFIVTLKRTKTKVKNKYKAHHAEIVILYGSENGTTLFFVNQVLKQLLSEGSIVFVSEMNKYEVYPNAKKLLIFTSTYGLGDAPTNASLFKKLLLKNPQQNEIEYTVVGFGSKSYVDFCSYAKEVDKLLKSQSWAKQLIPMQTVNERSAEDFVHWAQMWSLSTPTLALATSTAIYQTKNHGLKKYKIVDKTTVSKDNSTFLLTLKAPFRQKYNSGDLLAVYPLNNQTERFYSIGKRNNKIQLLVKLIPNGLGSSYLYSLEAGNYIKARVLKNELFHFPAKARNIAMIANGTGIAPFLGMIEENKKKVNLRLYVGFRNTNTLIYSYQNFANQMIKLKKLQDLQIAFSREGNKMYVMDLIKQDAGYFADLLKNKGIIMICGSLAMKKDVEITLAKICKEKNKKDWQYYIQNNQILTDCY